MTNSNDNNEALITLKTIIKINEMKNISSRAAKDDDTDKCDQKVVEQSDLLYYAQLMLARIKLFTHTPNLSDYCLVLILICYYGSLVI